MLILAGGIVDDSPDGCCYRWWRAFATAGTTM